MLLALWDGAHTTINLGWSWLPWVWALLLAAGLVLLAPAREVPGESRTKWHPFQSRRSIAGMAAVLTAIGLLSYQFMAGLIELTYARWS